MNPPKTSASSLTTFGNRDLPFEVVANAIPALMWICDSSRQCRFVNRKWLEFTGTTDSPPLGDQWMTLLHPDDRLKFTVALDLAISGKSELAFQTRLRGADGNYRWMAGTVSPMNDLVSSAQAFLGCCTDVSYPKDAIDLENEAEAPTAQRERRDEKLKPQITLIEAILDSMLSMITVVDRNMTYLAFNRRAEEYTGKKRDEVVGRNMIEVFPDLLESSVPANIYRAFEGEVVRDGLSAPVLTRGKFFEAHYIPMRSADGQVGQVLVILNDLTSQVTTPNTLLEANRKLEAQNAELQRQTQFIETLFDSIVDVITVIDTGYHYISVNRSALEKYGYKKEDIIGRHIIEVFPSVEHSGMYRDLQRAMNGEFVYDLSYTSRVLNARRFQHYYVPLTDNSGKVYAVMIIGHDITELLEATERAQASSANLVQKNRELERSNQELEQFAYVASHDLQEPIRKIATYANKLLTRSTEDLGEETVTYLKRISNATVRMYELINGLLVYSRVTRQGNLFAHTSLEAVIRQVINDFELKIAQKKAVIRYDRLPELEAVPVQMTQMFTNLISNSLKFSKKDVAPVIQISSSDLTDDQKEFYGLDPKARYFNIFFLDNGIGFEQQYAEKIFDLFQRLHARQVYEGSGIGLAICKKITANHNGLIYAFSEPGKGTTFQIILPYSQKHFA